MSFIPLIGIIFGLITITWGLFTKRRGGKWLALVGTGGIASSAFLYGGLFYFGFVQRGGVYDDLRAKMAQNNLNSLVQTIEFYKITHGEYPDSLATLKGSQQKGSLDSVLLFDPRVFKAKGEANYFYYQRVDSDHYYLRGVAPDGKPFSPGALVPQVSTSGGKLGLLVDPPKAQSSDSP
jgi:hypothetical protein